MAIDLSGNPLLEAAQDSQSRHPLVEILSQPTIPDIPFDGQALTSETTNEKSPNAITHSSGIIALAYALGPTGAWPNEVYRIRYAYSDAERSFFTVSDITLTPGDVLNDVSLCELENGNIGLVYYVYRTIGTNHYRLFYRVISPTGGSVVGGTEIAESSTETFSSPFVIRLANDSYLLVYTKVDGSNYRIMKRTCSDFQTWSAESEIAPSGLELDHRKYDTSLKQIDSGDIWLVFAYVESVGAAGEELTNIYRSISSDNGANWGAASALTTYTDYLAVARHPILIQKSATQMQLLFHEVSGAIYMDETTSGWCGDSPYAIANLHFDSVARKLYAVSSNTGVGNKSLRCVLQVDVDTWEIDKCWDYDSVPAFNDVHLQAHSSRNEWRGDGKYTPVGCIGNGPCDIVSVLDSENDTITLYAFADALAYGITKNITGKPGSGLCGLVGCFIVAASRRMYCLLYDAYDAKHYVGYIDLTQIGPSYTYNPVCSGDVPASGALLNPAGFKVYEDQNLVLVTSGYDSDNHTFKGGVQIYTISDGGEWKNYNTDSDATFPYHGLLDACILNNHVYGGFKYEADFGRESQRGLCDINLGDDTITYHRPTYLTIDDYDLQALTVLGDGRIAIVNGTSPYGVAIFDRVNDMWINFDYTTLPGITKDNAGYFICLDSDPVNQLIFGGAPGGTWQGLSAFSWSGYINQSHYKVGAYAEGVWTWGSALQLVQGIFDYDLVAALDPDDQSMFAFWTNRSGTELSIKWDRENTEFDLSSYLVRGSEIALKRSVDGTPASLEFEVSHGHLFDPHNTLSLYSIYLKKFRKLNIRWGEKISGADYWQQAGVFFVTETSLGYKRPDYPTMQVKGEDRIAMWELAHQVATPFYTTYPEDIMTDLLTDVAGLSLSDIDLPVFDDRAICYIQWIEQSIKTILEQVCERFGYYPRIDVNGKFTAKKISDSASPDHVYSDLTKMMKYSPDDRFSDWTNQVIVKGEGRDWMEVLYNEVQMGSLSGSCGWWHKRIRTPIWYSDDHSRKCRYPRMQVIESVEDGPYFCEDGNEYLGPELAGLLGVYCIINGPDLNELLIEAIIIWILFKIAAVIVNGIPYVGGLLSLVMWILETFALYNVLAIMGTEGRYEYNFYARPIGYVRQSVQATAPTSAEDKLLQSEMGMLVTQVLDDPLCYTVGQCQKVADFEWMVVKNQKKRAKNEKMAHLQDEDGDTIQINHPITSLPMRIFITDLTRAMRLPSDADSNDGEFVDRVEGWKVS